MPQTTKTTCQYRISAKALILDESRTRFLIVQEKSGKWELPGGGLDYGETPQDCIRHEIKEEMGLSVRYVSQRPAYFLALKSTMGDYRANVFFETRVSSLDFNYSDECVALKFVTAQEAMDMKNAFPNIKVLGKLFDNEAHQK